MVLHRQPCTDVHTYIQTDEDSQQKLSHLAAMGLSVMTMLSSASQVCVFDTCISGRWHGCYLFAGRNQSSSNTDPVCKQSVAGNNLNIAVLT